MAGPLLSTNWVDLARRSATDPRAGSATGAALLAGHAARKAGLALEACPFDRPGEGDLAAKWREGWHLADAAAARLVPDPIRDPPQKLRLRPGSTHAARAAEAMEKDE